MERMKKKRVGRPRSVSVPAVLRSPKKVKKRTQWSEEVSKQLIKNGESVLRAAREHGVQRQTI